VVIRLLEAEGSDKNVEIKLNQEFGSISKTDMIEENPVDIKQSGKTIHIPLGKNAVDTYKMKFSK
jgi:alpha-mannosidase